MINLDQHLSGGEISAVRGRAPDRRASNPRIPVIFVVEDDRFIRELLQTYLELSGLIVKSFDSAESFLGAYIPTPGACLVIDMTLRGKIGSLQLLSEISAREHLLPTIMISGSGNIAMVIEAMKSGAADYIKKPVRCVDLLACIERVLAHSCHACQHSISCIGSADNREHLTTRQKQVMDLILIGHPSKNIASDLGISQRTVENHRAAIMKRTGAHSVPDLARMSLTTPWYGIGERPLCFAA